MKKTEIKKKTFAEGEKYLRTRREFIEIHKDPFLNQAAKSADSKEMRQFFFDVFHQLAYNIPLSSEPVLPTDRSWEWPYLSQYKGVKQRKTQEEMKDFCCSVKNCFKDEDMHDYVVIEFASGFYTWNDKAVILDNACIDVELDSPDPSMRRRNCFTFHSGDRMDAAVYIHDDNNGTVQAVLQAVDNRGVTYYFELSGFSMLFLMRNTLIDDMLNEQDCAPVLQEHPDITEKEPKAAEACTAADSGSVSSECPDTADTGAAPLECPDTADTGAASSECPDTADSDEKYNLGIFTLFSKGDSMLYVVEY